MSAKKLYRRPAEGKITGVSAGLADYLSIDVTLVRILFVIGVFATGGFVLILYIIMAVLVPVYSVDQPSGSPTHIAENAQSLAKEFQDKPKRDSLRNYIGAGIIFIGLWLLLEQLVPSWIQFSWSYVWPIVLIVIGLLILFRKED